MSISTGVHAHPTVNVYEVVAVGDMILTEMNGTKPADYTFHKKNKAVILGLEQSSINIDGDKLQIDPLLLFQRLTTVMHSSDDLELPFKHELCSYPPALFDSSLLLNEAGKPALADLMWKMSESGFSADIPDNGSQYVLSTATTHPSVHRICNYKYKNAVVVFDGYEYKTGMRLLCSKN